MALNYNKLNADFTELGRIKNTLTGEDFDEHYNNLTDLFYEYLPREEAEAAEKKIKKVVFEIEDIQKRLKETIEAKFKTETK